MFSQHYLNQVKLLVYCLPFLEQTPQFALKGGTAINFFIQDMPRLSVDIDLTYIPLHGRDRAIEEIESGLFTLSDMIAKRIITSRVKHQIGKESNRLIRLHVLNHDTQIKIEPNFILRGHLYPVVERDISSKVSELFDFPVKKVKTLFT